METGAENQRSPAGAADPDKPIAVGLPIEVTVYYEDTDAGGVVYYANYLKYFERGRTMFFQSRHFPLEQLHGRGIVFTVVEADIRYRSPARYGDVLIVQTELVELKSVSLRFRHTIKNKRTGTLVATGTTRMGCVTPEGKPSPIPTELKMGFASG